MKTATTKAAAKFVRDADAPPALDEDIETGSDSGSLCTMADGEEEVEETERVDLADKETAAVFRLRLLVLLVLLVAAVIVTVIVYFITSTAQKDEYKTQYEGAAKKVLDSFLDIMDSKLGAVSSMGVAIIAHGVDHVLSWPRVTLSSFQQRASTARKNSGSLYIHMNPYVTEEMKDTWEAYTVSNDSYWIDEGIEYQKEISSFDYAQGSPSRQISSFNESHSWPTRIWRKDEQDEVVIDDTPGPYMPTWQTSPVFHDGASVNEDLLASPSVGKNFNASFYSKQVVIGEFLYAEPGDLHSNNEQTALMALMLSATHGASVKYAGDPMTQIFLPIFNSFRDDREPVAIMGAWVHWASYFQNILPETLNGISVVLHNTCSGSFTYEINGEDVLPIGKGDLHDPEYDTMKRSRTFETVENIGDGTKFGLPLSKDHCMVAIDVYPTQDFDDNYNTNDPMIMTIAVVFIFVFTASMFVLYDRLVERRQSLVMHKALQTNAIVTSLFPKNVHERLMKFTPGLNESKRCMKDGSMNRSQRRRLSGYLSGAQEEEEDLQMAAPIADLFPHCTVLFADIAGFTAWSSSRDPELVFILLQTIYQAFDRIAKRRKVFKVETIGDSYLAVCGLPEPEPNHALVMIRFAHDCAVKMQFVMRELEVSLGPDTGSLSMRFGLNSGPVTAGVLRGERARFQLFGDTVNTASRMESTGKRGKIQISQATADLVVEGDRGYWLAARKDQVRAKGKGILKTYFVDPTKKRNSSFDSADSENQGDVTTTGSLLLIEGTVKSVHDRLIEWMVDLLMDDVKKIVHLRRKSGIKKSTQPMVFFPKEGTTCMQEVTSVIEMPKFESKKAAAFTSGDYTSVSVPLVAAGLREYVTMISSLYHTNPFHNFEHACHVTMSVKKLLKRITTPELSKDKIEECQNPNSLASHLHACTHGITSDPLALLAITFSALIHDVDHRGCSNAQLAKENEDMGNKYANQSVAEQNSLDIAWEILMRDQFAHLRRSIFASQEELLRFRQLIVNTVLATDIFDKELNDLRKDRWRRAFDSSTCSTSSLSENDDADSDLRATIVIEHIIQASDVSHTMQHWHVYQKWNQALFQEMHLAYTQGRMAKDPATFWYQGEIGFFDNYVIPLAKKLKECGVFGVSSDEYLNYALQNRDEWEERGVAIVQSMVDESANALCESTNFTEDDGREDETTTPVTLDNSGGCTQQAPQMLSLEQEDCGEEKKDDEPQGGSVAIETGNQAVASPSLESKVLTEVERQVSALSDACCGV